MLNAGKIRHNILYTTSFTHMFGGGQWSLYYMVKNLNKELFHPLVMCPGEGELAEKMKEAGADIIFLNVGRIRHLDLFVVKKLISIIKNNRISLIHTDSTTETFYAGIAARIMKMPLVWHVRSSTGERVLDRLLYPLATRIVVVAKALHSRFDWIKNKKKVVTIHNGIDLKEFDAFPASTSVRNEYGIDDTTVLLACVGRIEEGKGQEYLVRAMGQIEGARLLLIGEGEFAYLQRLKALSKDMEISYKIIFAGYRKNVPSIMKDIDIAVFPSLGEAFPRVILEAMSAGKPVIATDVGGNPEAVADGMTGFVVPARDVAGLASKINELICDRKKREAMGLAGRKRVEEMFQIYEDVTKMERLYLNILKSR